MNQFYVSIIFLGILLIVVSLVWILYDRKRSNDYMKQLDEKKEDLVRVISDSELMLEELNKFSDYVVTQMDLKNEELCARLKFIDERIKQADESIYKQDRVKTVQVEKIQKIEKVVNGSALDVRLKAEPVMVEYGSELITNSVDSREGGVEYFHKPQPKVRDKVIPLNSKHKEVIQLAEKGMTDTEIAKKLSMGKGEIQLILGMNK